MSSTLHGKGLYLPAGPCVILPLYYKPLFIPNPLSHQPYIIISHLYSAQCVKTPYIKFRVYPQPAVSTLISPCLSQAQCVVSPIHHNLLSIISLICRDSSCITCKMCHQPCVSFMCHWSNVSSALHITILYVSSTLYIVILYVSLAKYIISPIHHNPLCVTSQMYHQPYTSQPFMCH